LSKVRIDRGFVANIAGGDEMWAGSVHIGNLGLRRKERHFPVCRVDGLDHLLRAAKCSKIRRETEKVSENVSGLARQRPGSHDELKNGPSKTGIDEAFKYLTMQLFDASGARRL
jgi:hypothetical protein